VFPDAIWRVTHCLRAAAPTTRATTVENRRFLGRAVRYDLAEPGLVLLSQWRPGGEESALDGPAGFGAVGQIRID
jgi:hypothetical protein